MKTLVQVPDVVQSLLQQRAYLTALDIIRYARYFLDSTLFGVQSLR